MSDEPKGKADREYSGSAIAGTVSDVEAVMELYGWRRHRESGSHCVFVKAGHMPFVVPKVGGRMVKGIYLDKICDLLGLDE